MHTNWPYLQTGKTHARVWPAMRLSTVTEWRYYLFIYLVDFHLAATLSQLPLTPLVPLALMLLTSAGNHTRPPVPLISSPESSVHCTPAGLCCLSVGHLSHYVIFSLLFMLVVYFSMWIFVIRGGSGGNKVQGTGSSHIHTLKETLHLHIVQETWLEKKKYMLSRGPFKKKTSILGCSCFMVPTPYLTSPSEIIAHRTMLCHIRPRFEVCATTYDTSWALGTLDKRSGYAGLGTRSICSVLGPRRSYGGQWLKAGAVDHMTM